MFDELSGRHIRMDEDADLIQQTRAMFNTICRERRTDAQESIAFLRELEYIYQQAYEAEYPEALLRSLVPVSTQAGPGAESITFSIFDKLGLNYGGDSVGHPDSDDFNLVEVFGRQFTQPVVSLKAAYKYTVQDLRAARMYGRPLDQMKGQACREYLLRQENMKGLLGNAKSLQVGLFNHPNANIVTIPTNGLANSSSWYSKTPELLLNDLNLLGNASSNLTIGVEKADTMLMPIDLFNYLSSLKVGIERAYVLEFFLKGQSYIKQVIPVPELSFAGATGGNRVVCYKKDPRKLVWEVPQDFETFAPQLRNMTYFIPAHMRIGGMRVIKPKSLVYADGM